MMPLWTNPDFGNDQLYQLYPVYSAIGLARRSSAALRSSNRYYLDQVGGAGTHQRIFSIAKYATPNASPGVSDVVFGFVNLDRAANQRVGFRGHADLPTGPRTGRDHMEQCPRHSV